MGIFKWNLGFKFFSPSQHHHPNTHGHYSRFPSFYHLRISSQNSSSCSRSLSSREIYNNKKSTLSSFEKNGYCNKQSIQAAEFLEIFILFVPLLFHERFFFLKTFFSILFLRESEWNTNESLLACSFSISQI